MKIENLVAIDTHVHVESEPTGNAAEEAARKYFGNSGVSYGRKELAEYYRSRNIGCVVFSVDERLTGRPQVPNDEVAAFAAENSDIVIAFASVDPMRGNGGGERSAAADRGGRHSRIQAASAAAAVPRQ